MPQTFEVVPGYPRIRPLAPCHGCPRATPRSRARARKPAAVGRERSACRACNRTWCRWEARPHKTPHPALAVTAAALIAPELARRGVVNARQVGAMPRIHG